MRTKTEFLPEPSFFTRIYRYFYHTNVSILANDYINFSEIDSRIEHSGLWLKSSPMQVEISVPKDFAEEIILKLRKTKNILYVDSGSQTVWLRLIAPLVTTGLGTIVGIILGSLVFPGIGTLAGAFIGMAFGAGLGVFGVGLDLIIQQKFIGGTISSMLGGMAAGSATGALLGSVAPGFGTLIGALLGAITGGFFAEICSLVLYVITDYFNSDNDFGGGSDFSISESSEEDELTNTSSLSLAGLGGKPFVETKETTDQAMFGSLYIEIEKPKDQEKTLSPSSTNSLG